MQAAFPVGVPDGRCSDRTRRIRALLARLRAEHRDLDVEIVAQRSWAFADQLLIKRLKEEKLALKDRIQAVEDQPCRTSLRERANFLQRWASASDLPWRGLRS